MKIVARPIEMVVWFAKDGCPNPIKFRLENDDSTLSVIRIDRILHKDMEKLAGNNMLVFRCQSIINGIDTVYELKYELRTCKWMLYKM